MTTIAKNLEDFGFLSSAYQNNKNGSRISAYSESPFQDGLYSGWKTFPSAPIVREVKWNEILKKNQKIKISNNFRTLKPLVLSNGFLKVAFNLFFKKHSNQFNNSKLLEFQNILVSMSDGKSRATTSGDVYSFDFESSYRIIVIKEEYGYMVACKDCDFKSINVNIMDYEKMFFLSTSLLTFVDLVELR